MAPGSGRRSVSTALDFDVIVIGSGFGGAISADLLSGQGHKVLVLERGPWRDTLPVRSMGIEDRAALPLGGRVFTHSLRSVRIGRFRLPLNRKGLFEVQSFKGLHVASASSVGGATIAWGALVDRPADPAFWQDRHPDLDAASVEQHYGKVIADLEAVELTPDTPIPMSIWDQLPGGGNGACVAAQEQPRLAMKFAASLDQAGTSSTDAHGIERQSCTFDGDGFLGSAGGAKASVDFIYLARAIRQGAKVQALCEVSAIVPIRIGDSPAYEVRFKNLRTGKSEICKARRVVLAAGTLNSVSLLARSSAASGGLAEMPALGQGFGANGDLLGLWTRDEDAPSGLVAPPFIGNVSAPEQGDAALGIASLAWLKDLPVLRHLHKALSRRFLVVGMGADSGSGRIGFKNGRLTVDYNAARESVYSRIRGSFARLGKETGSKVWLIGKPLTVHPWGGARIGPDPQQGVIDHRGEVYGNPGLYVADGSALPAAPGRPPALAIAAWAHHVAGQVAGSLRTQTAD